MKIPIRTAGVVVGLLVLLSVTLVVAAPAPLRLWLAGEPIRTGTDPLSPTEQSRAQQLALQNASVSAQIESAGRVEILRVERHQEPKSVRQQGDWPRRADIYFYDYDSDTLTHAVINLATGAVDQLESTQGVQLPLTAGETAQAVQIALTDPQANRLVAVEYQRITGQPLADPATQLAVHPLIFRAEAMPARAKTGTAECGLHRCAQLILATPDDALINVTPVVDLSTQQLVDLDSFITE